MEVIDKKRSIPSTAMLMMLMMANSPKKGNATEEAFSPVASLFFDENWEGFAHIKPLLDELCVQGYVSKDLKTGKYELTGFGQKICLQNTHNTPDFKRLADANVSTCFAMMLAAFHALENHLREQDRIVAAKSPELTDNLRAMVNFFAEKLGMNDTPDLEIPTEQKEVKKTKKTKAEVA